MGTITCSSCGRHTAARSPTCRHCGFDPYQDRREGRVEDYGVDRVMRRIRAVLYVIFLPIVGLLGQIVVGALVLLPFFFVAALSSGATGDGPVELMQALIGFVLNWPGYLIMLVFTYVGLYRRFQRIRTLTHNLVAPLTRRQR
ncbi:MAG: hypothetical protein OXO54_01660 [Chloroflexota bacterium]|nr:hypothetical protein [bacterium]MDE2767794.1 hypothetical protein [Chloroflexota bacterium]MDE2897007.1 hypothetical protein [Chloroflexota bacterium]